MFQRYSHWGKFSYIQTMGGPNYCLGGELTIPVQSQQIVIHILSTFIYFIYLNTKSLVGGLVVSNSLISNFELIKSNYVIFSIISK